MDEIFGDSIIDSASPTVSVTRGRPTSALPIKKKSVKGNEQPSSSAILADVPFLEVSADAPFLDIPFLDIDSNDNIVPVKTESVPSPSTTSKTSTTADKRRELAKKMLASRKNAKIGAIHIKASLAAKLEERKQIAKNERQAMKIKTIEEIETRREENRERRFNALMEVLKNK